MKSEGEATDLLAHVQGREISSSCWRFPEEKLEIPLSAVIAAAEARAAALAGLGVGPGDRVAIMLENCWDYPALLLGLWALGATAVPLRPQAGSHSDGDVFLTRVHQRCHLALLIFADPGEQLALQDWAHRVGSQVVGRGELNALAAAAAPLSSRRPLLGNDIALVQYSSGSTADPKGVIVTHDMVMNQVRQIDAEFRLTRGGQAIGSSGSWLPFHHDMGLFMGILFPLFAGCANLLASPRFYMYRPKRWFALQAEHRVEWNFTTNLAMANSFASLEQLAPGSLDLSGFQLYLAAEKVAPAVLRRCREILARFGAASGAVKVGYGMAENTLGATSTKDGSVRTVLVAVDAAGGVRLAQAGEPGAVEVVSIGKPHVGTQVDVVDEQGEELPELRLGELVVRGPCVSPGYYGDTENTAATMRAGRLYTRDIGFHFDDELYFFSRRDDVMVIGGRNIAPEDIESCAEAVDGVAAGSAVLIDVPSAQAGRTDLVLLIEPPRRLSDEGQAARRLAIQTAIYAQSGVLVNRVVFAARNALEKTSSGKKRRTAIRARFLTRQLPLC
jgi:acyl-CoA synthetase (AMP-forming)/AMP-acid ligase II